MREPDTPRQPMPRRSTPRRCTKLYAYLVSHGLRQAQVAALSGVSLTKLSRIARGVNVPSTEEQRAIAGALGLPVEQLFDPLAGLEPDAAAVEKLCAFLRGPEGKLMVARLVKVLAE